MEEGGAEEGGGGLIYAVGTPSRAVGTTGSDEWDGHAAERIVTLLKTAF